MNPVFPHLCLLSALFLVMGCQKQEATTEQSVKPADVTEPEIEIPTVLNDPIEFIDVSQAWGFSFQRNDDIGKLHRIIESNGGGVGVIDFDCDGWEDLIYTNGCQLPVNSNPVGEPDFLVRNLGGNGVVDVRLAAGVTQVGYHHGCTVGDWNNDGFDDLYIAGLGRNLFYVNNGDGTFREMSAELNIEVRGWSSSPAFADLDSDGNLDLYVTNYVLTGDDPPRLCADANAPDGYITCPPTVFEGAPDVCLRSDGAGQLENVTQKWKLIGDVPKGLGCLIADVNQDGRPDVYVANDGVPNFLFMGNSGEDAYTEEAFIRGCAADGFGRSQASMGIAHGDYDRNGYLDLYVAHFYSESNTLYRGNSDGYFEDQTKQAKLNSQTLQYLAFGTLFIDPDNDGWLDLFAANGHIDDMRWRVNSLPYEMTPQLFRNNHDGIFNEISSAAGPYFREKWLGRGAVAVDLNHDGRVDLSVSHQLAPSSILLNETPAGESLSIRCIGVDSNRSGISTKLFLETDEGVRYHEIVGGGSYNSASDRRAHFGLGESVMKSLTIQWPSGNQDVIANIGTGRVTIIEGGRVLSEYQ